MVIELSMYTMYFIVYYSIVKYSVIISIDHSKIASDWIRAITW